MPTRWLNGSIKADSTVSTGGPRLATAFCLATGWLPAAGSPIRQSQPRERSSSSPQDLLERTHAALAPARPVRPQASSPLGNRDHGARQDVTGDDERTHRADLECRETADSNTPDQVACGQLSGWLAM